MIVELRAFVDSFGSFLTTSASFCCYCLSDIEKRHMLVLFLGKTMCVTVLGDVVVTVHKETLNDMSICNLLFCASSVASHPTLHLTLFLMVLSWGSSWMKLLQIKVWEIKR